MPWLLSSSWLFSADQTVQFSSCEKHWNFFFFTRNLEELLGAGGIPGGVWEKWWVLRTDREGAVEGGDTSEEAAQVAPGWCSEDLHGDEQQGLEVSTLVGGPAMSQLLPDLHSWLSFTDPPKPPSPRWVTYPWGRALAEQLVIRFWMNVFS